MKQEMMGWQQHQLDHRQIICTSLLTDNHASISLLFFKGRMLFLTPNQQCQSTEGKLLDDIINRFLEITYLMTQLLPVLCAVQLSHTPASQHSTWMNERMYVQLTTQPLSFCVTGLLSQKYPKFGQVPKAEYLWIRGTGFYMPDASPATQPLCKCTKRTIMLINDK